MRKRYNCDAINSDSRNRWLPLFSYFDFDIHGEIESQIDRLRYQTIL